MLLFVLSIGFVLQKLDVVQIWTAVQIFVIRARSLGVVLRHDFVMPIWTARREIFVALLFAVRWLLVAS